MPHWLATSNPGSRLMLLSLLKAFLFHNRPVGGVQGGLGCPHLK